jgi:DNA-binding winged helix-turn-helix (wHTH) protein
VDNQIFKLRQKLELDPKSPSYFVTVHGIGYKFVPEESDSGVLFRLRSSSASVRRDSERRSENDGTDLKETILRFLSVPYAAHHLQTAQQDNQLLRDLKSMLVTLLL